MYHYKQLLKFNYPMASSSNTPQTPKSRGHTLFDRQAQLHAYDSDRSSNHSTATICDPPLPVLRPVQSVSSAAPISQSPQLHHRRITSVPLASRGPESHSSQEQLSSLPLPPPDDSNTVQEEPGPSKSNEQPQETDFPLVEDLAVHRLEPAVVPLIPTDSLCCAVIEQAFDYLPKQDDDDDDDNDVVHHSSFQENEDEPIYDNNDFERENQSDGGDSVDTIDLDAEPRNYQQNNNDLPASSMNNDKRRGSEGKLTNEYHSSPIASSSRGTTASEDNDSDVENQSHEDDIDNDDDHVLQNKSNEDVLREKQEQQRQLILRQHKILWSIEQEWLRKEKSFLEELEKLGHQLNSISSVTYYQNLVQKLIFLHKNVQKEIELLQERDHQSSNLIQQLIRAIEALMQTLPSYDEYIQGNLAPIRKALEKRSPPNGTSVEDLLSIPAKQFLQILSQVQDVHKTAQSFESDDRESLRKLYDYALKCKLFGSRQEENINKVILKNEDVAILGTRGNRDRCHLILYPDAIVCCYLKTRLLVSPKYTLIWFIPMIDLQWVIQQPAAGDTTDTGDELKSHLKSAYKELEKSSKANNTMTSRLSRNIRKQENEYNLAQSKLQLVLSNASSSASRASYSYVILFSSAYQRQDWIDLIDKTKQELVQRSSTLLDPVNTHHQRLTESLIQKRLEFVKPIAAEPAPGDASIVVQPSKTYSGTLNITIHSLHGSSLCNPLQRTASAASARSNQYQFYVAVEIDSYNTFYPYAQTGKQAMQQQDSVEFRGEVFQVEVEHSLAFRLLIYRIDISPSTTENNQQQQRAQCIGKFHRNIETGLSDCQRQSSGILPIESPSSDLKLRISLKYSKREGTFKRQGSKRNLAVFGKSIEQLTSSANGLIDGIPRIIVKCIEMVDRDGLEETGIYRVCCVTSDLQKLRHQYDRQQHRADEMLTEKNVHVAANLLKLFFRELPEPLFTSALYRQFVHAIQLTDMDNQRVTLLKTFELLHPDNRRILLFLLDHLLRVSKYSTVNMMHLENLAVVFGPTLMRPSTLIVAASFSGSTQALNTSHLDLSVDNDQMSSELQGSMYQCQVVLAYLKLRRDGILK